MPDIPERNKPALPTQRDPSHIRDCLLRRILRSTEGSTMYLLYGLLIVAMMFFLVLPITDARTARMKLSVVSSLGVLLAVSVMVPRLLH
jgi:di/tricarboxylate transporter